jgi:catalase (peroxidase I)
MRFEPELTDGANAGLGIMQDIIKSAHAKFPDLSTADLWTMAGTVAVKLLGGPDISFQYGRQDAADATACPPNGRLPDASQGAEHLRDVFYRMGFDDRDIVALSGAHTLGSCHELRSGFDGPWTKNPLKFDNEYFKNLLELEWTPRKWDGPMQYEDPSGTLMMLPTDLALIQDEKFLVYVKAYAEDEKLFFHDFAKAFAELLSKGCPSHCQPGAAMNMTAHEVTPEKQYRDLAMHGSVNRMKEVLAGAEVLDVNAAEAHSGRTALHKAAFFGHAHVVTYLVSLGVQINVQDGDGDTALHDAARLGHLPVVQALLQAGVDKSIFNRDGKLASDLAAANGKDVVVEALA